MIMFVVKCVLNYSVMKYKYNHLYFLFEFSSKYNIKIVEGKSRQKPNVSRPSFAVSYLITCISSYPIAADWN